LRCWPLGAESEETGDDRYLMKTKLILLGLLAGLLIGQGCSPPKEEKAAAVKPRPVEIVVIERRNLPIEVRAVGRLAANREVVLSSQVSGIVQSYGADTGDAVAAEQTLVTLDPTDYRLALNEARANLLAVRARFAAAKNSYQRAEQLLPQKVITPEFYDKVEAEYKAAQGAVSQAEIMVDINQRRLDKTVIKVPFDGLVAQRLVEIGQNINIGDPVMAIADMARMRVKISVNEQDYVHLDKDDPVRVRVAAYPEAAFSGRVDKIGVKADPRTNTFEIEILVNNPDLLLKAGLTAKVSITVDEIRDAIMIPQDSVLFRDSRKEVFVVTGGDRAAVREVTLGRVDGSSVRILDGLGPGDRLVTTGAAYLKDGDRVAIAESTS